ncbi:hypothetical protein ACKFKG_27705 [Phormidesmis sp. 146-35]
MKHNFFMGETSNIEIYQPSQAGKYVHEPQGMARLYPRSTK